MLLLLDRDGVINRDNDVGIFSVAEFTLMPRAAEAIAMLCARGVRLAICTNQSGVGRGVMTHETLDAIHAHMQQQLTPMGGRIDRVYYAPDAPENASDRRKPGAGMLREALADFSANAAVTPFVGDMARDMEAALAAGCPRILVKTGKGTRTLEKGLDAHLHPVAICEDVYDAAEYYLQHYAGGRA